jgi:hypothetical protein
VKHHYLFNDKGERVDEPEYQEVVVIDSAGNEVNRWRFATGYVWVDWEAIHRETLASLVAQWGQNIEATPPVPKPSIWGSLRLALNAVGKVLR